MKRILLRSAKDPFLALSPEASLARNVFASNSGNMLFAEAGYSGWIICEAEQDPAKAHPLTYARKGYAHLRATVEKLGERLGQHVLPV